MLKSTVSPLTVIATNGGIGNTVNDGFCGVVGIGCRSRVMLRAVRKSITRARGKGRAGSTRSA